MRPSEWEEFQKALAEIEQLVESNLRTLSSESVGTSTSNSSLSESETPTFSSSSSPETSPPSSPSMTPSSSNGSLTEEQTLGLLLAQAFAPTTKEFAPNVILTAVEEELCTRKVLTPQAFDLEKNDDSVLQELFQKYKKTHATLINAIEKNRSEKTKNKLQEKLNLLKGKIIRKKQFSLLSPPFSFQAKFDDSINQSYESVDRTQKNVKPLYITELKDDIQKHEKMYNHHDSKLNKGDDYFDYESSYQALKKAQELISVKMDLFKLSLIPARFLREELKTIFPGAVFSEVEGLLSEYEKGYQNLLKLLTHSSRESEETKKSIEFLTRIVLKSKCEVYYKLASQQKEQPNDRFFSAEKKCEDIPEFSNLSQVTKLLSNTESNSEVINGMKLGMDLENSHGISDQLIVDSIRMLGQGYFFGESLPMLQKLNVELENVEEFTKKYGKVICEEGGGAKKDNKKEVATKQITDFTGGNKSLNLLLSAFFGQGGLSQAFLFLFDEETKKVKKERPHFKQIGASEKDIFMSLENKYCHSISFVDEKREALTIESWYWQGISKVEEGYPKKLFPMPQQMVKYQAFIQLHERGGRIEFEIISQNVKILCISSPLCALVPSSEVMLSSEKKSPSTPSVSRSPSSPDFFKTPTTTPGSSNENPVQPSKGVTPTLSTK